MSGSNQRTYTNFSGGVNNYQGDSASPVIVDNGDREALMYAEASQNWQMAENGLIEYAGDIAVLLSALSGTPAITGLYDWKGTLIGCGGGKVYTVSGGTATQIYTGATAGKYYQFTEWDNGSGTEILLMMNGTDKPLYYDGSTCTTITVTDDVSVIWNDARPQGAMVFRGSLFYWGDPTHPHRVYKPRPGSYNNFDNTEGTVDAFDVDAGFGGVITGMKALTSDLACIYKQRAIRRMAGVNPFGSSVDPIDIQPITDEFGCIAPRSIVQVGVDQYFLAEDGLRRLKPIQSYGDIDPQQPTYPVQGIINGLNFTTSVIQNACAVFHRQAKQIWLAVPNGASTTNSLVLIHNVITGGTDPRADNDIAAGVLATFNHKVYSGDYAGQLFKHGDDFSYNGVAIDAEWESKWIAHLGIGRMKVYRELHIYAESDGEGSLICQYSVLRRGVQDSQNSTEQITAGSSAWDTAVWDTAAWGSSSQQVFKIKNLGKGNALKLKFINSSNNQRVKIRQVDLFFDAFNTSRG